MLNDTEIRQRSIRDLLVEPYSEGNLQPHSLDLTLDREFLFAAPKKKGSIVYAEKDRVWEKVFHDEENPIIKIPPKTFVLASTVEKINMPLDLVGLVYGKSTIARRGLQIECAGLVDAGFRGQITLEMYNFLDCYIELNIGMPICQVLFSPSPRPETSYEKKGHYCGQTGPTPPHSIN